ncbi:MAG: heme A synthase [Bacteroidetes bacterium]|nr:heme A synthase [Bacteroidota bacterium]
MKNSSSSRAVVYWLYTGMVMIVIQILLGGITRLTGSGLSITEWNVVTGALPPLSDTQWLLEFEKYKTTPQFRYLNFDFSIVDFKIIYFWEWFHRNWARLIGVVFAFPFLFFLWRGYFKPPMIKPLIVLFLFGALQGAIGWIMVASGLTGDAIYVKPARLALHFMFALGLLCYTFWFALQLTVSSGEKVHNQALKKFLPWILSLLFLQLIYGAFLAGHKAATAAPTWPTINQEWIPGGLFKPSDGSINWIDNLIFLHFVHRGLAYLLLLTILYYTAQLYKQQGSPRFYQARKWPAILVLLQVLLGILSVLASTKIIPGQWGIFEWIAQLHQLVAMLLLLSLVQLLFLISRKALGTT